LIIESLLEELGIPGCSRIDAVWNLHILQSLLLLPMKKFIESAWEI
jgi:hypothetical protein